MFEILHDIDIAVRVSPSQFLERMANLGEQSGLYHVERHSTGLCEQQTDIVNFRSLVPSPHEDHGFQLIAHYARPGRIAVEMRAKRWSPDPPTKDAYIEAARNIAGHLLKQYNQSHGTRHRLRIAHCTERSFRMTKLTAALVSRFTMLANIRVLHFYDWQRFYALIREGRQEIPEHILRRLLLDAGFTTDRASQLVDIYAHLWAFKRLR